MKRSLYKIFALVMVSGLTACGYSLNELYNGDSFNSVNFADNYYSVWNDEINYKEAKNKITSTHDVITLDESQDSVFTSYTSNNFRLLENNYENYVFNIDGGSNPTTEGKYLYGPSNALSDIDASFKYGFISRLFDGEIYCDGNYERVRVQYDEDGFGRTFTKELYSYDYFAINFKTSVEFRRVTADGETITINIPAHKCNINLLINFYLKNDTGFTRVPVTYTLNNIPCNPLETHDASSYVFFGFDLHGDSLPDLSRCAGLSMEYTLLADATLNNPDYNPEEPVSTTNQPGFNDMNGTYENNPLRHAILLYEVLFPNSTWH